MQCTRAGLASSHPLRLGGRRPCIIDARDFEKAKLVCRCRLQKPSLPYFLPKRAPAKTGFLDRDGEQALLVLSWPALFFALGRKCAAVQSECVSDVSGAGVCVCVPPEPDTRGEKKRVGEFLNFHLDDAKQSVENKKNLSKIIQKLGGPWAGP